MGVPQTEDFIYVGILVVAWCFYALFWTASQVWVPLFFSLVQKGELCTEQPRLDKTPFLSSQSPFFQPSSLCSHSPPSSPLYEPTPEVASQIAVQPLVRMFCSFGCIHYNICNQSFGLWIVDYCDCVVPSVRCQPSKVDSSMHVTLSLIIRRIVNVITDSWMSMVRTTHNLIQRLIRSDYRPN